MKIGKMWTPTPAGQEQFAPETLASAVLMDETGDKTLPQKLAEIVEGAAPETHNHDLAYLGKSAKAADSDKLDGYHASDFAGASHTHNYAAASHEHGRITYSGVDNNVVSAQQTDSAYYGSPASWASYLIMNHGNGANYYHQMLRFPFFDGSLQRQTMDGGTLHGWKTILDTANFLNYVYPVGAIYMAYASTSPASLFGGTWSALPTGRFLRTGTGGSTGGSDTHVHSTPAVALTIGQMPYHNHAIWDLNWEVATGAGGPIATAYSAKNSPSGYAGGNEAHGHGNTGSASNVPAYYEVYAWRRTA